MAKEDDSIVAQVFSERIGIVRPRGVRDALETFGPRRASVAAMIVVDQRGLVAEIVERRRKGSMVKTESTVHQQYGPALAISMIVQIRLVDVRDHTTSLCIDINIL